MVWNSFEEFLHMGGYGFFVWGATTVTFLLMLSEALVLWARKASLSKRLQETHELGHDVASDSLYLENAGIRDTGETGRKQ